MNAARSAAVGGHAVAGADDSIESLRLECEQTRKALCESNERFRELAENINEAFWTTDSKGERVFYVSPGYEKIWGRPGHERLAAPGAWIETIHKPDRPRVLAALPRGAAGTYDLEYRIVRPDGAIRWVHDKAFPVRDVDGAVQRYVGVAEDITDRKALEEQIRHAQKMDAIGTLAGGVAHDFNNILSVINGYADLIRMSLPSGSDIIGHVDAVKTAGARATRLVRQILTFSRREESQREKVQLATVVEDALKFLRATIPATIEFKSSLSGDTPAVLADATQVHQVLLNLGTNAWHAMKGRHGLLEVSLAAVPVDAAMARMQLQLQPGLYARISVRDTGTGMDQKTLARIFEPYFTTKPPGEGTGLGLSVVHGIMRSHDGAITVSSEPGKGTTFDLYFPALPHAVPETQSSSATLVEGNGERILFVDDEELIVGASERILRQLNYTVEGVSNPKAALEAVRARPGDFDLVITDLAMPVMTGIQLARQILRIRPDLPVILMTGFPGSLNSEEVRAKGIRELLLKPPTVQSLSQAVRGALDSSGRG